MQHTYTVREQDGTVVASRLSGIEVVDRYVALGSRSSALALLQQVSPEVELTVGLSIGRNLKVSKDKPPCSRCKVCGRRRG